MSSQINAEQLTREKCVKILIGTGWPETNKPIRGKGTQVCLPNSIGYIVRERRDEMLVVFLPGENSSYIFPRDSTKRLDPLKTGDYAKRQIYKEKICATCFILKPLTDFPKNRLNQQTIKTRPHCADCYKHIAGAGLSGKARKEFLAEKGKEDGSLARCPICYKWGIVEVTAHYNVDHDPNTGDIRGLICGSCNTGLGKFDDPDIAERVVEYLRLEGKIA